MYARFHNNKETELITIAQQHPNDNEHQDGTQTSSPKFFCAITSYQRAKEIIHEIDFKIGQLMFLIQNRATGSGVFI